MRTRLVLAAAAFGALALAAPSALAAPAPANLDGKKIKTLSVSVDAKQQVHDADTFDINTCADRCLVVPFIFNPAKGVKGDVMFTATWGSMPTSDIDLYVAQINGKSRTEVTHCAGATTGKGSEKIFLAAGNLKRGKTYAMIVDFYRTAGEKVTGTVEMPAKDTTAKTVPAQADGAIYNVNCTL